MIQASIAENVLYILAIFLAFLKAFAVKKLSFIYLQIFILVIFSSFLSILNNEAVNNMEKISTMGNSYGMLIFIGFYMLIFPSSCITAIYLLRKMQTI